VLASGLMIVVTVISNGCGLRQVADRQAVGGLGIALRRHLDLVEQQAGHLQLVAVEHQRRTRISAFAPMEDQARFNLCFGRIEFEGEIHTFQDEVGGAVICQMNDPAGVCSHCLS